MNDIEQLRERTLDAVEAVVKRGRRRNRARASFYKGALLGWLVTSCFVVLERLI